MTKNYQPFFKKSFILMLVLFLCSCASTNNPTYGPVQDENFHNVFLDSIANDQQEVIFYSRAIWYPNKNGFKFLPAGKKSRKGVIVYTDQGVYFSEWGSKQYTLVFSSKYDQINEMRLAANELFGRVVVKTENYNSFEILGVEGPHLPNKEETEIAFQILEQQKGQ